MEFELPLDIATRFDPMKNKIKFLDKKDDVLTIFEWMPFSKVTTMDTVEKFLTNVVGMTKVEQSPYHIAVIEENLEFDQSDKRYWCSYTFLDESTRDKLALPQEVELYHEMDMYYANHLKTCKDDVFFHKDIKEIWKLMPKISNTRNWFISKYKLLHLYIKNDDSFGGFEAHGLIPLVIEYSLYHLLGKAPTPEQMGVEWYMYLQFLIDIGYVKEV